MAKRKDNPENTDENLSEGNNGDDNFGLPDIEYKPLDTASDPASGISEENVIQNTDAEQKDTNYSYTPVEEPKSKASVVITVIIGIVLIASAFLYYQYVYKPSAEKAKKEQLAKEATDKKQKEEAARLAKEKEEAERLRIEAEKAAAANMTPAEGTVEILNARTGRYYVVVSSAIDDDLTMDYAKKLSADGTSIKIIPPFGKSTFYRLTIGNYDSFAEAQTNADAVKAKYGESVWVIKY